MPFNGSGVYSRTNGTHTGSTVWAQDDAAGVDIVTDRHDTHDQDIGTALSNVICKDGQSTPTANIPLGGFKITNLGAATTRTDAIRAGQIQDGAVTFAGASGGSANAQTLTPSPAITAYASGVAFTFRAGFSNTAAAPTLNVSGVGAKDFRTPGDEAIPIGFIRQNALYSVVYHASFNSSAGAWAIMESSGAYIAETVTRWTGATYTFLAQNTAGFIAICAGTANTDGTGAKLALYEAAHGSLPGQAYLTGDGGKIQLRTVGAFGVEIKPNDTLAWEFESDGDLAGNATNGGNQVFQRARKGPIMAIGGIVDPLTHRYHIYGSHGAGVSTTLPSGVAGEEMTIYNADTDSVTINSPSGGSTIYANGGIGATFSLGSFRSATFLANGGNDWYLIAQN